MNKTFIAHHSSFSLPIRYTITNLEIENIKKYQQSTTSTWQELGFADLATILPKMDAACLFSL